MEAPQSTTSPVGTYSQSTPAAPSTSASSSSQQLIPIAALRRTSSEQECPYDLNDYPAHRAAWEGDTQRIGQLRGIGNRLDQDGLHPTHIAILRNQPEALKALLPFWTDHPFNFETHGRLCLLGLAFIQRSKPCVDLLLEYDPNMLNQTMGLGGGSIVHLAARNGLVDMLYHLVKTRFEAILPLLDGQDANHRTPLSLAAEVGDRVMVEYLWERGASLEARDSEGKRPLHWAALSNQQEVIQLLAKLRANLEPRDTGKPRRRPIDYARGETYELLDGLLNKRAFDREQKPTLPNDPLYGVWSGGGLKCFELIGCAKYLHEKGKLQKFVGMGGTSGGAFLGSWLAVGYTPDELERVVQEATIWQVMDHPKPSTSLVENLKRVATLVKTLTSPWELIDKTVSRPGILSGEQVRTWLDQLFEKKTGHKHCTFKQLRQLIYQNPPGSRRFKHLHIVCTRIGKKRALFFPNTRDKMWDDFPLSELVAASGCFPVVFKPIKPRKFEQDFDGGKYLREVSWSAVDGGILMNCPDRLFDQRGFIQSGLSKVNERRPDYNPRVVAFKLYSPSEQSSEAPKAVSTPLGAYSVYREVQTIRANAEDLSRRSNPYEDARIVYVDNLGLGVFHLTNSAKIRYQIEQGFRIAKEAFEGTTSSSSNTASITRNRRRSDAPPDPKGKGKAGGTIGNDSVGSNEEETQDSSSTESRQVTAITQALIQGNTEPFKQHLPDRIREQVLQGYPFGRSAGADDKVLQAILDIRASFTHLSFSGETRFSFRSMESLEKVISLSPSLRYLRLDRCHNIKGKFLWTLPKLCPHLRELSLVDCSQLKDVWSGYSWLTFPNLKSLSLAGSGIERFHISAPQLTSLDFSQCKQLTRLRLRVSVLKQGKLDGCPKLNIDDIKKIVTTVQTLDLSSNGINDKAAEALGRAWVDGRADEVGRVRLALAGVGGVEEALFKFKNVPLTTLDLSNNCIGTRGADWLSPWIETLTTLNLSNNVIGNDSIDHDSVFEVKKKENLVGGLVSAVPLSLMVLSGVVSPLAPFRTSTFQFRRLWKALAETKTLTILDLSNNCIGDSEAEALAKTLEQNTSLKHLALRGNKVGSEGAVALESIERSLERNRRRAKEREGAKAQASATSPSSSSNPSSSTKEKEKESEKGE